VFSLRPFGLHKILFYFEAFVHELTIRLLPPPTCIARTIAILLHVYCAIYDAPPTPLLYATHHTILVMAISCKGQLERRHCSSILTSWIRKLALVLNVPVCVLCGSPLWPSPPVVGPLRGPPLCVGPLWVESSLVVSPFPVASVPRLASRSRSHSGFDSLFRRSLFIDAARWREERFGRARCLTLRYSLLLSVWVDPSAEQNVLARPFDRPHRPSTGNVA